MSNPAPTSTPVHGSTLQTSALKSLRGFLGPANLGQVSLGLVKVGQRGLSQQKTDSNRASNADRN